MVIGPSRCSSCGASVFWLRHPVTDKLAPINAEADPAGNIVLDLAVGAYAIVSKTSEDDARDRHTNHFATCPQAARWKRPARPGRAAGRE